MTRTLVVEADGGSRGNPGPAGYGALVSDAQTGEVLAELLDSLGVTTNNVAEYSGLIAGLRAAGELAPGADVQVRMDSKLVVEQMSGRWKVKDPNLRTLAASAREAAGRAGPGVLHLDPAGPEHPRRPAGQPGHGRGQRRRPAPAAFRPRAGGSRGGGHPALLRRRAQPADRPARGWGPARAKATTTLLLRHGQTPLSAERRFAGRGDIPLTDIGRRQAAAAAARLAARGGIDVIVSSPLRRTRRTAEAVAEATGAPVVVEDDLVETDFGKWEGLSFAEAGAQDPDELKAWLGGADAAPPGGESFAAVGRRVLGALDRLLAAYPEQTVLIVSHVTPIKTHAVPRAARAAGRAVPHSPGRRVTVRSRLVRRRAGRRPVGERHLSPALISDPRTARRPQSCLLSLPLSSLFSQILVTERVSRGYSWNSTCVIDHDGGKSVPVQTTARANAGRKPARSGSTRSVSSSASQRSAGRPKTTAAARPAGAKSPARTTTTKSARTASPRSTARTTSGRPHHRPAEPPGLVRQLHAGDRGPHRLVRRDQGHLGRDQDDGGGHQGDVVRPDAVHRHAVREQRHQGDDHGGQGPQHRGELDVRGQAGRGSGPAPGGQASGRQAGHGEDRNRGPSVGAQVVRGQAVRGQVPGQQVRDGQVAGPGDRRQGQQARRQQVAGQGRHAGQGQPAEGEHA